MSRPNTPARVTKRKRQTKARRARLAEKRRRDGLPLGLSPRGQAMVERIGPEDFSTLSSGISDQPSGPLADAIPQPIDLLLAAGNRHHRDRLSLPRIGVQPDPRLMSTVEGRHLALHLETLTDPSEWDWGSIISRFHQKARVK